MELTNMMRLGAIILAAVVFPGVAVASPAIGDEAIVEQETIVGLTQSAAVGSSGATETLRGVVESVDQGSDTMKIRLPAEATEQFKVQDGLIFNAVRYGDHVEVTIENIAGAKTIVGLSKE
jgi:hypothetical protein